MDTCTLPRRLLGTESRRRKAWPCPDEELRVRPRSRQPGHLSEIEGQVTVLPRSAAEDCFTHADGQGGTQRHSCLACPCPRA
jgi:hypothetical protein